MAWASFVELFEGQQRTKSKKGGEENSKAHKPDLVDQHSGLYKSNLDKGRILIKKSVIKILWTSYYETAMIHTGNKIYAAER